MKLFAKESSVIMAGRVGIGKMEGGGLKARTDY